MAEILVTRGTSLLVDDETDTARPILKAFVNEDSGEITIELPNEGRETFASEDITVHENTGRLNFVSNGTTFSVRELREDDGEWLSRYRTLLPIFALEQLITQGAPVEQDTTESLAAYSLDESAYVLGLIYTNEMGRWARIDGDWVLLASDDESYTDMIVDPISAEKAEEFIDLYDNNYVSVSDLDQYTDEESDDSDEPELELVEEVEEPEEEK